MSGRLTYGNYQHAANEVVIRSVEKSRSVGPRGSTTELVESWGLEGILQASSVAALTTAMRALEAAYAINGQSLAFAIDGTNTLHTIAGGLVTVTRFSWDNQFEAEYTTFRSYSIDLEARIPVVENELIDFRESLVSSGGLPDFRIHTVRNGSPIVQMVAPSTPYRANQSGFAVGYSQYPAVSLPIFGSGSPPLRDREISRETPDIDRGRRFNYPIRWSYTFESVGPMFGIPRPR